MRGEVLLARPRLLRVLVAAYYAGAAEDWVPVARLAGPGNLGMSTAYSGARELAMAGLAELKRCPGLCIRLTRLGAYAATRLAQALAEIEEALHAAEEKAPWSALGKVSVEAQHQL